MKVLRTLPLLASLLFVGNRGAVAEEPQEAKVQLPEMFASHDDGNRRIDPLEAIEIFNDKALGTVSNVDSNRDGKITKDEMNIAIDWFHRVSRLPNVSPETKALCLDNAANLYKL